MYSFFRLLLMSGRRSLSRGFSTRKKRKEGNQRLSRSKTLKSEYNLLPITAFNGYNEGFARAIVKDFYGLPIFTPLRLKDLSASIQLVDFRYKNEAFFDVSVDVLLELFQVNSNEVVRIFYSRLKSNFTEFFFVLY